MANLTIQQKRVEEELLFTNNNIFISATAGCLGKDTKILMYDGTIKNVQDINVGDKVMGLDSKPRNVLNTNKGKDKLYKIIPTKGDPFICNSKHILTLHNKQYCRAMKTYKETKHKTPLVDIPILNLLESNKYKNGSLRNFNIQRYGVEFKKRHLPIDPYLLGIWLAEGTKHDGTPVLTINSNDIEIINYLMSADVFGLKSKIINNKNNCVEISFMNTKCLGKKNPLRDEFKKCITNDDIGIPFEYLTSSREQRLQLLAGLIDGDGYVNGHIEIITKFKKLNTDILYLCRSLGLAAYSSKKVGTIKDRNFVGYYHRISISGNLEIIPNKLLRKKSKTRKQIKDVLRTGITIEDNGYGEWYGFSVDKDNRFLLGDFTVTHNSGKTFTLKHLSNLIPKNKKIIFLAFNKSIAEELKSKLPENVECVTIHSKMYSILRSNIRVAAKLYDLKKFVIAKKLFGKREGIKDSQLFKLADTSNLCLLNLKFNAGEIKQLCCSYRIDIDNEEINDIIQLINEINKCDLSKKENKLDFTDMLYMTWKLIDETKFPKYDYIMLDEVQDLNALQRECVLKLKKQNSRIIAVGDDKQSIYSFQGSNTDSFNYLKTMPKTTALPLSVTFRCSKALVKEAHKYFDDIEAHENNKEGLVRNGQLIEARIGDFVLCRNNLPLIMAFIILVNEGKKCKILGSELEKNLLNLLNEISDIKDLSKMLDMKIKYLENKEIEKPETHPTYIDLKEKCEILSILYRRYESIDSMKDNLHTIFGDNTGDSIMLMTIHKSKGLEAERVFALNFDLLPSKYARTEIELYQEKCLQFVCVTRAKNELIYCKIKV